MEDLDIEKNSKLVEERLNEERDIDTPENIVVTEKIDKFEIEMNKNVEIDTSKIDILIVEKVDPMGKGETNAKKVVENDIGIDTTGENKLEILKDDREDAIKEIDTSTIVNIDIATTSIPSGTTVVERIDQLEIIINESEVLEEEGDTRNDIKNIPTTTTNETDCDTSAVVIEKTDPIETVMNESEVLKEETENIVTVITIDSNTVGIVTSGVECDTIVEVERIDEFEVRMNELELLEEKAEELR